MTTEELRAYPRVSAPVRASWLGPQGRADLPVRDISQGGIFVFTPTQLAQVGDELVLEIDLPTGGAAMRINATVVRAVMAPGEDQVLLGLGLQFTSVTPEQQANLAKLIAQLLEGPGGHRRAYPRISHRLEVQCDGVQQMRGVLRDLSLGGAGLWLDTPVAVGQELVLELRPTNSPPLKLQAKVVSTHWGRSDEPFDQAGVRFEGLSDETRGELRKLLSSLIG
jgi:c-di-GMP-binding flagellar brake protein YcgR